MLRKFRNAAIASMLAATLAACVTTGLKPGEMTSMSRAEASKLQARVFSVELDSNNKAAIKKSFLDLFVRTYSIAPTNTQYGDGKIVEETDQGFRLRTVRTQSGAYTVQPPDLEIVFFLEDVAGQPNQQRANIYYVAIQNPGPGEQRYSLNNVGFMDEDRYAAVMGNFLPQVKQAFAAQTPQFMPKPPGGTISVLPSRNAEMIKLEKAFLAGDADGMRQQARLMANAGSSVAQCALAYADFNGIGGAKNAESGQQWLNKSLAANDVVCKAAADLYGWGRKQDTDAAVTTLRLSAEAGNVHAVYLLGSLASTWSRNTSINSAAQRSWLVASAQLWSAARRLGLDGLQPQLDALLKTLNDEERGRVDRYASQWPKL